MPKDLPQERDQEFEGERCIKSIEFCGNGAHLLGGVNEPGADGLAECAEGPTGGGNVQRSRGHGLGLDGGPVFRSTWFIE